MTTKDISVAATPVTRRYVRYVISLGVSIGVGLAPFLGKIKVPLFDSLLELFPRQLQGTLIPCSAFLMGLVALGIQFGHTERVAAGRIRRYFRAGFVAIVLGFFLFVVIYKLFVIRVPIAGGTSYAAVIVTPTRLPSCGCKATHSDFECAQRVTINPVALASCWGGRSLVAVELSLMIPYLLLTAGFGALIGLLILKEDNQRVARQAQRGREAEPATFASPKRQDLTASAKRKPRRSSKPT